MPHIEGMQFVIWTRYVNPRGLVIRHAYGPYATRSRALTARKHMDRSAMASLTPDQRDRYETAVVALIDIEGLNS